MKIKMALIVALFSTSYAFAEKSEPQKTWAISPSNSCDSLTITLPSPAIDYECDIDTTSGNPSTWFNPMASCNMDFDLIGLPTLGDIAAGLTGQVCSELNAIKDKTIDDLFGDDDSGGNGGNGNGLPNPDPIPTEPEDEMCYTQDSTGKNIIVPCSITDSEPSSPDTCYLKEGDAFSDEWRKIKCSRPTVDYEMCVIGYETDDETKQIKRYPDGTPIPIVESCKSLPANMNLGSACYVSGSSIDNTGKRAVECGRIDGPVSQYNRMCEQTTKSLSGQSKIESVNCIEVDETCYGHLNGVFKAASCSVHTDNFYKQLPESNSPNQKSNSPSTEGRGIDDSWEW